MFCSNAYLSKRKGKMRSVVFAGLLAVSALALCGCQTMQPATYSNYGDNTFLLKKIKNQKIRVGNITDQSNFDSGCRLVGPIKTSGDRPLGIFIRDSLNDELKFANLYSDDENTVVLSATLQSANFSSLVGVTQGFWSFSLQLSNPENGKNVSVNTKYAFDSGFLGDDACRNVANALTPAVQLLVNKVFADPNFVPMVTSKAKP